jgi:hypothetical protein
MSEKELADAVAELNNAPKIDVKGKWYTPVVTRIEIFRKYFGLTLGIHTKIIETEDPNLIHVQAFVVNQNNFVLASGLASEDKRQGFINKTSALEVAETSAIGRALAAFGLHGGEYASSFEMENAISNQDAPVNLPTTRGKAKKQETIDEFIGEVKKNFPSDKQPVVTQYEDFYIPAGNNKEEIDEVFAEVDRISDGKQLAAYFTALGEAMQWMKPDDLKDLKASFKVRAKQLEKQ